MPSQVLRGLDVDEALDATHHPCSKHTLYRQVKQVRAQLRESAQQVTREFIEEDAVDIVVRENEGDISGISYLSPSPDKIRKSSRAKPSDKTVKAIEDGVL